MEIQICYLNNEIFNKEETEKSDQMEKQTSKTDQNKEKNYERSGLIDGLPNNYHINYVLTSRKTCSLCHKQIQQVDIDKNKLVCCMDDWEFYHKDCVEQFEMIVIHQRPNDKASTAKLLLKSSLDVSVKVESAS